MADARTVIREALERASANATIADAAARLAANQDEAAEAWSDDDAASPDTIDPPMIGGIVKTKYGDKDHVFAWSGTVPDRRINVYSWNQTKK